MTNPLHIRLPAKLRCRRCGWRWLPRQRVVKLCPHCKSRDWQTPKNPHQWYSDRTVFLGVTITNKTKKALKKRAKIKNVSLSQLVSDTLDTMVIKAKKTA